MDVLARQFGAAEAFTFDWATLRYQDMTVIQTGLMEKYKLRTAARIMCAVKGAFKAARKIRLKDTELYETAIDLPMINRGRSITGRELELNEITALMKICRIGPPLRGTRDTAIIILMAGCGLRENEVTHLSLADYNPATGIFSVHGKGGGKGGKYALHICRTAPRPLWKIG